MYTYLDQLIYELSCRNPDVIWEVLPDLVESIISDIISNSASTDLIGLGRLRAIRGALLAFIEAKGLEDQEGLLLNIAKIELLKLKWK